MKQVPSDTPPDPIHTRSHPDTFWTVVNAAEAFPGVVTPLTWTLYARVAELSLRRAFCELGVLRPEETRAPEDPNERFIGVFYGRAAVNVDRFRAMADRCPGQSGDGVEKQLFGTVRPDVVSAASRGRYPFVAAKAPGAVFSVGRRLKAMELEADAWWRAVAFGAASGTDAAATLTLMSPERARAILAEARDRFTEIMVPHTIVSMLAPALMQRLAALCAAAGRPGLELRLLTGHGAMHETMVMSDLWSVSRDRLAIGDFVARHGYHGPSEGELAARPWREDPSPLEPLIKTYATMDEAESPMAIDTRRRAEAAGAEQELLAALPAHKRPGARLLLRIARHIVPLRETGRGSFLRVVDAGRVAARALGPVLVDAGALEAGEDVAFLTIDELLDPAPNAMAGLVAERRARFEEYTTLHLPDCWTGNPEPVPATVGDDGDLPLHGFAVSPGVVEARARVVLRADEAGDLEPGEVLVCPFTDPGWTAVFLMASAVVIDVGGPMSHGAIVARELGLPGVINTRVGTAVLRTGDLIRVDGGAGTVDLLERGARRRNLSAAG